MFHREDWTLFRNLGTLGQKAGVPLAWLRRLVVKELMDNALDASGGVGVKCGKSGEDAYWVEDGGDGIPGSAEEIASLFSIDRPLASTKVLRLPLRGALGNGLRVVVGAVLASGGSLNVTNAALRKAFTDARRAHYLSECRSIGLDWFLHKGGALAPEAVLSVDEKIVVHETTTRLYVNRFALAHDPDEWREGLPKAVERAREVIREATAQVAALEKMAAAVEAAGGWDSFLARYNASIQEYVDATLADDAAMAQ